MKANGDTVGDRMESGEMKDLCGLPLIYLDSFCAFPCVVEVEFHCLYFHILRMLVLETDLAQNIRSATVYSLPFGNLIWAYLGFILMS